MHYTHTYLNSLAQIFILPQWLCCPIYDFEWIALRKIESVSGLRMPLLGFPVALPAMYLQTVYVYCTRAETW